MAKQAGVPASLKDWRADNEKDLRTIWQDLHPESDEDNAPRTFRGQILTPEQSGDVFERWVLEAFRLSGMRGHYSFRVPYQESDRTREQIDGLVLDGWQAFLIESKFWPKKVDFGSIAHFHYLVEMRPVGILGMFFSAFGYTVAALESASFLRPIRVLCFDRWDIEWVLSEKKLRGRMHEMVLRKWMLAVKFSRCDAPVSESVEFF